MSSFNEKWFKYVESLPVENSYSFIDFIFSDNYKRKIILLKITKNIWMFSIEYSEESNENCYNAILKYNTNEKTWFKIINPTLTKINEKLSNLTICKYHISCHGVCCLDMINTSEETCPICLKDFEKHYLTRTKCGHYFCLNCLNCLVEEIRKDKDEDDDSWFIIACPLCLGNICSI